MKNNPIDKAIKYCEKEATKMFDKGGVLHNWDNGQAVALRYKALPRIKQIRRELIKGIQTEINKYDFVSQAYIDGLNFALNLIKKDGKNGK